MKKKITVIYFVVAVVGGVIVLSCKSNLIILAFGIEVCDKCVHFSFISCFDLGKFLFEMSV